MGISKTIYPMGVYSNPVIISGALDQQQRFRWRAVGSQAEERPRPIQCCAFRAIAKVGEMKITAVRHRARTDRTPWRHVTTDLGRARVSRLRRYPGLHFVLSALAVAALMVPYLLPVNADAASQAPVAIGGSVAQGSPQSFFTSSGVESEVARDGYTVTLPAPKPKPRPRLSFARSAGTFVNNPNSPIQWPFTRGVPISSAFGSRIAPCSGCSSFHNGLDMTAGAGAPIQAIADGVVREVGNPSGALGVYAIIDHQVDGQTVSSLYAHMAYGSLAVAVGQQVKVGQLVGLVGSTGASTGAHLHLGIFVGGTAIDPYAWLTQRVQ